MNWDDIIVDAAATDTGMRRSNNQDSYTVVRSSRLESWRQRGHLFMVADGMGAHAVGELASKLACDTIPHNHNQEQGRNAHRAAITKAYKEVGALIHGKASANRDFQGMGTTCSTLVLLPEGALIAHVGDSRVYRSARRPERNALVRSQLSPGNSSAANIQPSRPPKPSRNVITRKPRP